MILRKSYHFILILGLICVPFQVAAQEPGVNIQGRPVEETVEPPEIEDKLTLDFHEELRKFIQSISLYARSIKPNFVVIARDAHDIIVRRDQLDFTNITPARTLIRTIDGILQDGIFMGHHKVGKPTKKSVALEFSASMDLARKNGLQVLSFDYARKQEAIIDAYTRAAKAGYRPFVAHEKGPALTSIPPFPEIPFNENSDNVLSIHKIKNFLYLGETAGYGRQDEFSLKIHSTNYDAVIVDVFHGRRPLTRQAIETLKYKKLGSRRLVLARMDIGTAASYRYYWKPDWGVGNPFWIADAYPRNPDRFIVEFWRPEWQQIITGSANSYIYGIIKQGFDGVVLEGLLTYLYFEMGEVALIDFELMGR